MMKRRGLFLLAALAAALSAGAEGLSFDAGADLRIRQEIMRNVPGLPGGGLLSSAVRGDTVNHMRFRPRVWGEIKGVTQGGATWRLYTRLTDEFRWGVHPSESKRTWPGEVILDNLFIEAKDLFDGRFDFRVGRQDLYNLYGLDHVFIDGTPADGSRSVFTDMARFGWKFTETERLDVFVLHNWDDNPIRFGTDRSKHMNMTGLSSKAEPDMDDWGWGAVWTGRYDTWLDYNVFALQKITEPFWIGSVKHVRTRRETFGVKLVPHLTDEWSLQLEGMGQVGRNGDGDWLSGWSTYAGVNWKSVREGVKPFGKLGFHTMSGDKDAADQDGGHHAWDPLWARGVNDSEMMLYGTHYGAGWWSNMMYLKLTGGVELSRLHKITCSTGPMFAQARDGLGGGDGLFKGYLSQARYDFPLWRADKSKGERFELFGHVVFEHFIPGDYFETSKPAWFFRWQVDMKF